MLGNKLREAIAKLTGRPYVDEAAVKSLIKDLQRVLLASDVNVKLVFELSKRIEERALKTEKKEALTLKEHVVKVVYEELVRLMGETYAPRVDKHKVLLCGLYGSGKTTTCAKLAKFYKNNGLSVLLVGADVDRPAAQEQLQQLAQKVGAKFYTAKTDAPSIVKSALENAKEDVIIVDSAGRSALDDELAKELKMVYEALKPEEVFLVITADIGQVAGKQATEFNKIAPISGVIVTRMDGSGKGGGALSAVAATGAKIAFIGVGEKIEDFEVYKSEKFVGRLLGMPDLETLLEKIKQVTKEEDLKKIESEGLTIETFYEQLKAAKKLGPLSNIFSMLGVSNLPKEIIQQSEEKMKKYEAIINSMTKAEKKDPKLVKGSKSRIARIAKGSGCSENEIREFLSQFEKVEKMMEKFQKDRGFRAKMEKMMKGIPPGVM
ncbi:MAG: signal recognition particle receptor subunit alpha [Candidatus Bilamarchaeaceae archaeon]